jgi:quercetin dioxygenase-like cupin family protein
MNPRKLSLPAGLPALAVAAPAAFGQSPPSNGPAPEPRQNPRVRPRVRETDGLRIAALSRSTPPGVPRAFHLTIRPTRTIPDQRSHEGHEWLYVLGGRIRLLLAEDDLILKAGEAAEFSTWTPHWIGAVDGPAEVLALMGPQGERVHLRSP